MSNWSHEALCRAEEAMYLHDGTLHEKLAIAIDAAIAQRHAEENAERAKRLSAKIEELSPWEQMK